MKSSWRTKLFKNIRFRGKMILVFVIGGVIPFFGVTVYLNNRAANSLIEQNKKAQKQELHLMASILEDAVPDMEKVCEKIIPMKRNGRKIRGNCGRLIVICRIISSQSRI